MPRYTSKVKQDADLLIKKIKVSKINYFKFASNSLVKALAFKGLLK